MEALPSGTAFAALAGAVPGDAMADAVDPVMGTAQMIHVDAERGCYVAVTDPRGDGVALAL